MKVVLTIWTTKAGMDKTGMTTFSCITQLEGKLKAAVQLDPLINSETEWRLSVRLFYDGEPAGVTSFDLHGYSREEAEVVAKNIKTNDFLMKEIDDFLWGESD